VYSLDALWTYVWHKGEKGGDLKKMQEHFLDWKSHRHGEPPASGLCNRQNGEEIAPELMKQVKMHAPDEGPPAMSSDGKGAYPKANGRNMGKSTRVWWTRSTTNTPLNQGKTGNAFKLLKNGREEN